MSAGRAENTFFGLLYHGDGQKSIFLCKKREAQCASLGAGEGP